MSMYTLGLIYMVIPKEQPSENHSSNKHRSGITFGTAEFSWDRERQYVSNEPNSLRERILEDVKCYIIHRKHEFIVPLEWYFKETLKAELEIEFTSTAFGSVTEFNVFTRPEDVLWVKDGPEKTLLREFQKINLNSARDLQTGELVPFDHNEKIIIIS